jgi:hypothetical protein
MRLSLSCIPIAITGALSHFRVAESTTAQRIWTMSWLVLGIIRGCAAPGYPEMPGLKYIKNNILNFLPQIFFAVPAVGGYVVIGQMLKEFGTCTRLD